MPRPTDVTLEVGRRIRHLRIRVWGESARQLARRAGISRAYLEKIETGERDAPIGVLARVAGALGLSLSVLVANAPLGWGEVLVHAVSRWRATGAPRAALTRWLTRAPGRKRTGIGGRNPSVSYKP